MQGPEIKADRDRFGGWSAVRPAGPEPRPEPSRSGPPERYSPEEP